MALPADVMITISGPNVTAVQRQNLLAIERRFHEMPSPYAMHVMDIFTTNKYTKRITMKATR